MIKQRIEDAQRMLFLFGISSRQAFYLVLLGVIYAGLEGLGVGMLVPLLHYVEQGAVILQQTGVSQIVTMVVRASEILGLPYLLTLVLFAFLPILARQVFRYFHQVYAETVRLRARERLRAEGFSAFLKAPLQFYVLRGQGRLVSALTTEIEHAFFAVPWFLQLFEALLLITVYLVLLLIIAPWLIPMAALGMGAGAWVVRARVRRSRTYGGQVSASNEALHVTIAERLAGIRLVKMKGQESQETEGLRAIDRALTSLLVKLTREKQVLEVSVEPIMILGAFAALYVAVTAFHMTLADLGVFMVVLLRVVPLLRQVNVALQAVSSRLVGLENVHRLIQTAQAARDVADGGVIFTGLQREIRFDRVGFSYDGEERWALCNITFTAKKGSLTALVGRSGSGKSTLLDLIPRLQDVSSGDITIDGISTRRFDLRSLRSAIGIVDQEGFLFDDTMANNIAYGMSGVAREDLVAAAKKAHAHHFIEELPKGYDTAVGERGVRLSVGQRQRICLARVFLQNPDILLLDEPTSALDSESEQYIQIALDSLRESKVIIVVAHRLSTIKRADQIIVLDKGIIIERGEHETLLKHWGTYQQLFELQIQA